MDEELKLLIEDAAKLVGLLVKDNGYARYIADTDGFIVGFNPLNPSRGDLMKVAEAAGLAIDFKSGAVWIAESAAEKCDHFTKGDHQSLALAILRAASAVWKARNENAK